MSETWYYFCFGIFGLIMLPIILPFFLFFAIVRWGEFCAREWGYMVLRMKEGK